MGSDPGVGALSVDVDLHQIREDWSEAILRGGGYRTRVSHGATELGVSGVATTGEGLSGPAVLTLRMSEYEVGAYVRPMTDTFPAGTYRIVGLDERPALLRLTDADGDRSHTGRLIRPSRERLDDAFRPAAAPTRSALRRVLDFARVFPVVARVNATQLAQTPLRTTAATGLLVVGLLAPSTVPDIVAGGCVLTGALALALLMSPRHELF